MNSQQNWRYGPPTPYISKIDNKSFENAIMTSIRCVSQNRTSDDVMMTSQLCAYIIKALIGLTLLIWTYQPFVPYWYIIGWCWIRYRLIQYPFCGDTLSVVVFLQLHYPFCGDTLSVTNFTTVSVNLLIHYPLVIQYPSICRYIIRWWYSIRQFVDTLSVGDTVSVVYYTISCNTAAMNMQISFQCSWDNELSKGNKLDRFC